MRRPQVPRPMPPWRGTRSASLERLLRALLDDPTAPFSLTNRGVDDPTVALLDAWATMSDVLAFYDERSRAEAYIDTAIQPESVLALLDLTGVRPRPPVGSSVALAYLLHADPEDVAVVLPTRMLSQTVPGTGEQVQTFETEAELSARPSWNTLTVRRSRPVTTLAAGSNDLVVAGAAARLAPNDYLVWRQAGAEPRVMRVATATVDAAADSVDVAAVDVVAAVPAAAAAAPDAPDAPDATDPSEPGDGTAAARSEGRSGEPARGSGLGPVIDVLTALQHPLASQPPDQPRSRPPRVTELFSPTSESTPRLMAALQPSLAATLYTALATSEPAGEAAPGTLDVLRTTAAPFGANAAPQPTFDGEGRPSGSVEWPIAGSLVLSVRVSAPAATISALRAGGLSAAPDSVGDHLRRLSARLWTRPRSQGDDGSARGRGLTAVVTASAPGYQEQHRSVTVDAAFAVDFGDLGILDAAADQEALTVDYRPRADIIDGFRLVVTPDPADQSVTFQIGDDSCVWDPAPGEPFTAAIGDRRLTITLSDDADELSATLSSPLPYQETTVLHLDARHDEIVPGSTVVVSRAGPTGADASAPGYPRVLGVVASDTVSVARYGLVGEVTRLVLDADWVDPVSMLAAVRDLRVHAASDRLTVRPAVLSDDVGSDRLDLEGLHAGLDAGRRVVVTGRRTDLPVSSSVPSGELVEVSGVDIRVDAGGSPYTSLTLTARMTHTYRRDSVVVYGNVVTAHQGATVEETLGSGDPTVAHQRFTLALAPVLSTVTAEGVVASSLVVRVDGRRYDEVARVTAQTPATSYLCGLDATGHTTVTFVAPLPPGSGNVTAAYRAAMGGQGNVRAGQVSQPLTKPLAVTGVTNPLPASGGADAEDADGMRARAGVGLRSLGHAVSISDYEDLARSWPGVGKARASLGTDGRHGVVRVDVAGIDAAPLGAESELVQGLRAALSGPEQPIGVDVRVVEPLTIVVRLRVVGSPEWRFDDVAANVTDALQEGFAYDGRRIGEDVLVAELLDAAQSAVGVVASSVEGLVLLSPATTPAELATLGERLTSPVKERVVVSNGERTPTAQVAFVDTRVPSSVIVEQGER